VVSFDLHRSGPSVSVHTNMTVGTVMELAKHTNISLSTLLWILQQCLYICKNATKWSPHNFNEVYHWTHFEIWHINLEQLCLEGDTFLNETTAGDETWAVLQMYHPYSPNECSDQNLLPTNLMVVVAWDVRGGFNVFPYQKLEWNERHYMLFLQYWVGRGVQKWLKIMASYVIKVLPTQQIVFRMLS